MGNIYNVSCSKCSYSATLHLGGGLNSIRLPFLLKCLNEKDRSELQKLQEYGISHVTGINQMIRRCSCSDGEPLYEAVIVTATDKDGNLHTFGDVCNECGSPLEILDISKPFSCPLCDDCSLEINIVGHWD